ncbi:P-loop NTPase fold protein [Candidatus Cyanaurora vandensis]|uniref:KAP family P-loop NTPase fold protein n=1 Tax=Candidatus Cyanaurora vandensis TaxID=2714958 RepID=UPI00257AD807|nr:P-loop NTPase fold protein [Candidatus Cyanaurora vandensis]
MARTTTEGFDNPVARREEDFLDRWSFAREVFNIADTTPADWSVRIGVYGEWGAGKSSVMYFIESMALAQKHLVVRFNPWQFNTPTEMWLSFTDELHHVLTAAGVNVKDYVSARNSVRMNGLARRFEWSNGESAEKPAPEPTSTASGLTVLNQWLLGNSSGLAKLNQSLGQRRVIILVDDLDRTDLSLLPELLYAIRELLDLPRFVFVLCFDPNVVGLALKRHHPGWGDGTRFLEKIVDFPRWLPPLTRRDLLALARNDVLRYCTFISTEALERNFHLLPENPRRLRMFVRSLWSLKGELERYEPQEIDWDILLLVNLLKFTQPRLAEALFNRPDLLDELGATRLTQSTPTAPFTQLWTAENLEGSSWAILLRLNECVYLRDGQLIRLHALMTEHPPVITGQEFAHCFSAWQQNPDDLKSWTERHKLKHEFMTKPVITELYTQTIKFRLELLTRAADAVSAEEAQARLSDAAQALHLLDALAFKLEGFVGPQPLLNAQHFALTLAMVLKGMQGDQHPDQETQFLEEIVHRAVLPPDQLLACLRPWEPAVVSWQRPAPAQALIAHIAQRIAPRVAQQLLDLMPIPAGLQPLLTPDHRLAQKYVLLDRHSPLWQQDHLRMQFIYLCPRAQHEPAVQRNLLHFLELVIQKLEQDFVRDIEEVVCQPEVITAAWSGVLAHPINSRLFLSFKETRDVLEDLIEQTLPVPPWWERMARES